MMRISTISLALVSFLSHVILSAQQPVHSNCSLGKGTYSDSSLFHTNLNALLSNFASDTKIDYGFYNSSYGESPNRVNALGLCRGDVKPETCRSCLKNATTILSKECPNQMEAFEYYDLCMFRYSNRSIFGIYQDHDFSYNFNNPERAQDAEKYTNALYDLMQSLKTKAAAGDSHLKVAMGNATAGQNETVYGLAQCTPDLSQQDCEDCLVKAISDIPRCCQNKIGGRVIKLSCNLRFEKVHFYDSMQLPPASPAHAPSSKTTSSPPAQPDFFFHKCFNESGNYTRPSAYRTNLNNLLSNFTSDTKIDYGFYNYSYGETPNTVNALGMCRGDVEPDSCHSCLNNAITLLPKLCPYQKEAFGYYDLCMFRYASRQMFGIYQDHDFENHSGSQTYAVDANKYMDSANHLLDSLKEKAKVGEGSYHKVAAGNARADQSEIPCAGFRLSFFFFKKINF